MDSIFRLLDLTEHLGQEHRDRLYIGDEQQCNDTCNKERNDLSADFGNTYLAALAGYVEVDTYGRSYKADSHVYGKEYACVYQVNADALKYRNDDGQQDVECGVCIEEAACDKEDDVDDKQDDDAIIADRKNCCGKISCNTAGSHDPSVNRCTCNDVHDSCGGNSRVYKYLIQLFPPGIEPVSPALQGGFFTTESPGKPLSNNLDSPSLWETESLASITRSQFLKA